MSQAFWGTVNDKNIAHIDDVFKMLQGRGEFEGHPLSTREWYSVDRDGKRVKHYGVWLLCDGGYHKWKCLANPFKFFLNLAEARRWSKAVESARKDIECVFGILKRRFLMLKNPIRIGVKENIERMFLTCCVIHNMTMEEEGLYDWMEGEENADEEYDPLSEHVRKEWEKKKSKNGQGVGVAGTRSENRELYDIAESYLLATDTKDEDYLGQDEQFELRRQKLIEHYEYMRRDRQITKK